MEKTAIMLRELENEKNLSPVIRLTDLRRAMNAQNHVIHNTRALIELHKSHMIATVNKGNKNVRTTRRKGVRYVLSVNQGLCLWCQISKVSNGHIFITPPIQSQIK